MYDYSSTALWVIGLLLLAGAVVISKSRAVIEFISDLLR